ncbi:MAG: DNA-directed RNA polymerase subunit omega [Eggerthellaceae bacterium]|nr:DNA-directed RNA polymerase subunit omega [Eggerthellaceae bacterium]
MSLIEPKIEDLLSETDQDRFLLCSIASHRAHDINDMLRKQRDRAIQLQIASEVARASNKKPLSIAFDEISSEEVSYNPETIDARAH